MGIVLVFDAMMQSSRTCCSIQVLEHGLDHEVSAPESPPLGPAGEQPLQAPIFVLRDAAPLEAALKDLACAFEPPSHLLQVGVAEAYVDSRLRDRGCADARPHEPCADDAEVRHGLRFGGCAPHPRVLLECRRGEEDLHQVARDLVHCELGEERRFHVQPSLQPVPQAMTYRLERGFRSWVVATRLLEQPVLGRGEHDPPPERVLVERQGRRVALAALRLPPAGQPFRRFERHPLEDGGVHQLVHDPSAKRPLRGYLLAGQDDVERRAHADETRQTLAAAGGGNDAELDLGKPKLRLGMVGGNPIRTGEHGF
jgi:hypothetical protein